MKTTRIYISLLAQFVSLFTLSAAIAADLVIENVTLIDGTGRPPITGATVEIDGDRISRITRGPAQPASDARRIDGTGKFLIPGMIDVHLHLRGGARVTPEGLRDPDTDVEAGRAALHGYLYSGVTSIYDAGNNPDHIFNLRAMERVGTLIAPRIFATGGIVTYPGSHGSFEGSTLVDDWPEAIPLLEDHIARGPDMMKLTLEERGWGARPMIPMLPLDLMQHIIEYANDHGIRTTVHTSSELRARQAIFAGIDTLSHPIIQGPITDDFARLMSVKKIPMATTLTIGENYSRLVEHPEYLDQPLYRAVLEKAYIDEQKTRIRDEYAGRDWTWWMKIMTPIAQENLRKIHAEGGILAIGTDQTIGPAVHRELELIVAAGIPALDAIRIATLNGAVFLGRERDLGSIEEGKLADMVLLDGDPTTDINHAKQINLVIKGGIIIDRDRLDLPVNR